MAAPKYEIRACTGEGRDGKKYYSTIGAIWEKEGKLTMLLTMKPMNWDGFAFLSPTKEKDAPTGRATHHDDDPVPF